MNAAGTAVRTAPAPALEAIRAARKQGRRRRVLVPSLLAAAVLVLFAVYVLLGTYTFTVPDFFRILFGEQIPGASYILMESKLPRAVIGTLIGVAFGISGAVFQTLLRNPLASPDVIGISYGASASAVGAIVLFGATGTTVSLVALIGALAVALAIYLLARRGGVAGYRLVLVGIGFAAVMQAMVSYLLTRTDIRTASEALVWLNGSLNNSSWDRAGILALSLVVLLPAAGLLARSLHGLELGDDAAAGLGIRVETARLALIVVAVALAAVATAAAGPVAFIAFLSGPIARRLMRGETTLLTAGLVGACIVLAADFAGSNLISGVTLPVGVVTGALGAPFLLWLLVTSNRVGQGG